MKKHAQMHSSGQAEREASRARAEQMIAQALEQAKTSLAQSRSSGMLADTPGADPAGQALCTISM